MKKIFFVLVIIILLASVYIYWSIHKTQTNEKSITFVVLEDESVPDLAERLASEGVIKNTWLFEKYLVYKKIDRKIKQGQFKVEPPITISRVAESLASPQSKIEKTITIIPGWTLREISEYLETQGVTSQSQVFALLGEPAIDYRVGSYESGPTEEFSDLKILRDKPWFVSFDGFLAPDTYRIYADATLEDVVYKLLEQREKQITEKMYEDIEAMGLTFYEVLTMASILEKEARTPEDKAMIADIFWRRYEMGWALQADSTVHYIVGNNGSVFTSDLDRDVDSYWNTYKYPGLPLGPIGAPGIESIKAAIYPESNDYWYFLTTLDTGEVIYSKTLEEHNMNVAKYLR